MTQEFINKMKEELEEQKMRITNSLESQSDEFKKLISTAEAGDEADIASDAVDRNMLDSLGTLNAQRLELIDNALLRIKQGKYGICVSCGKEIPEERLEAVPYAFMCVDCKSAAERRSR